MCPSRPVKIDDNKIIISETKEDHQNNFIQKIDSML